MVIGGGVEGGSLIVVSMELGRERQREHRRERLEKTEKRERVR